MPEVYRPKGWQEVNRVFGAMNRSELPTVGAWLEVRASLLLEGWKLGSSAATLILSHWHPKLVSRAVDVPNHAPRLEDARAAVAREHGFASWPAVLGASERPFNPKFENGVDVMLAGEADQLAETLADAPELVFERSPFGHKATLLHYIAANGVETERQVTPLNSVQLVRLILKAGADPEARMPVYGGEFTTLQLLTTSAHPARAGVTAAVAEVLTS